MKQAHQQSSKYDLYFDGAMKHDEASLGYVLYLNDKRLDYGHGIIGRGKHLNSTIAEYYALSHGLSSFIRHWDKPCSVLNIYGDSKFVIQQVQKELHEFEELEFVRWKLNQIRNSGVKMEFHLIPRKSNKIANDLAKCQRLQ